MSQFFLIVTVLPVLPLQRIDQHITIVSDKKELTPSGVYGPCATKKRVIKYVCDPFACYSLGCAEVVGPWPSKKLNYILFKTEL